MKTPRGSSAASTHWANTYAVNAVVGTVTAGLDTVMEIDSIVGRLMEKLGVRSLSEAVRLALAAGLLLATVAS